MTSPIRTSSPATLTLARSTGAAMTSSRVCADAVAVPAASRAVARRQRMSRSERISRSERFLRGTLLPFPPPLRLREGGSHGHRLLGLPLSPALPHKGGESRARSVAAGRDSIDIHFLPRPRGTVLPFPPPLRGRVREG